MTKQVYSIWVEGYSITGSSAPAGFVADVEATSFREACIKFFTPDTRKHWGEFNPEKLTVWGCRLFNKPEGARKRFRSVEIEWDEGIAP